jgi:hypothetical protein
MGSKMSLDSHSTSVRERTIDAIAELVKDAHEVAEVLEDYANGPYVMTNGHADTLHKQLSGSVNKVLACLAAYSS